MRARKLLFPFVSLAVAVSVMSAVPAGAAPAVEEQAVEAEEAAEDSDGDGTPDRPDLVSAGATARVLKEPVEDLSQRTPTVQVIRPEFRSVLSFWRMDSCQDRIRTSSVSVRCGC